MALPSPVAPADVDPRSGYSRQTKSFYSLRAAAAAPPASNLLPPASLPVTAGAFTLSLTPDARSGAAAFVDSASGDAVGFAEFAARARSLAVGLRVAVGLRPGDVAFVIAPGRIEVPALYVALMLAGAVVSPANPASTPDEVAHQINLCKPHVAFAAGNAVHKLPPHVRAINLDSSFFRSLLVAYSDSALTLPPDFRQSDTAAILYSSGTTGRVKAVALSHRSIMSMVANFKSSHNAMLQVAEAAGEPLPPHSVMLLTVPPFHVYGLLILLRALAIGDTIVLMPRFDFAAMLRAVEQHKVTLMSTAPPVIVAMLKSKDVQRYDLSSLQTIGVGGAPLRREVAEQFAARFPDIMIVKGYGLTESAGVGANMIGPDEAKVYDSVGKLAANLEARIVDPVTGESLGPGEKGELWLRGPPVMKGYVDDDGATAATVDSEGWLKTGDLCYFNEDGFLFIVDRLKELIKYKGYQVPPVELELILQSHREIADAAVVPYPDDNAGEIPIACVVRQPGSTLTEKEVIDFVANQVVAYKKVRRVLFVSAIPRTPSGKILRRELVSQVTAKFGYSKL